MTTTPAVKPTTTKTNTPGQGQGQRRDGGQKRRRNRSRYGIQIEEKKGLKEMYGIREEQLKTYYKKALRSKQETGPALVVMLERRLDNSVFRAGLAQTRPQARQMVTHGLFTVNGHKVDIPSYLLKVGDVVSVKENKRGKAFFSSFDKRMQNVRTPSWVSLTINEYSFSYTAQPDPTEANIGVDMRAIVEFFTR